VRLLSLTETAHYILTIYSKNVVYYIAEQFKNKMFTLFHNIHTKNISVYIIEHARLCGVTGALPMRFGLFSSCLIAVFGRCISSKCR
jgi:hypothetical protein